MDHSVWRQLKPRCSDRLGVITAWKNGNLTFKRRLEPAKCRTWYNCLIPIYIKHFHWVSTAPSLIWPPCHFHLHSMWEASLFWSSTAQASQQSAAMRSQSEWITCVIINQLFLPKPPFKSIKLTPPMERFYCPFTVYDLYVQVRSFEHLSDLIAIFCYHLEDIEYIETYIMPKN